MTSKSESLVEQALTCIRRGNAADAERLLHLAVDQGEAGARTELGALLLAKGRAAEARSQLEAALANGDREALLLLGDALMDTGAYDSAEVAYRKAHEHHPDGSALTNMGLLMHKRGDFAQAEELLVRAAELGRPEAASALGDLLWYQNRLEEAERWYRDAYAAGHDHAGLQLGIMLGAQSFRRNEALDLLRAAVDRGEAGAANGLGSLLSSGGDYERAEAVYRDALARGDRSVLLNLGNVLADRGDLAAAEASYREAIEAGDELALFNLSELLRARGRVGEADKVLARAVEAGDEAALERQRELMDVPREEP